MSVFDRRHARREQRHKRQLGHLFAAAGAIAALVALVFALVVGDSLYSMWQLAARWTARVSLHLFAIAFVLMTLSHFNQLEEDDPRPRTALRGLAGSHFIHLIALIIAVSAANVPVSWAFAIPASFGYGVIFVLLLATGSSVGEVLTGTRRRWIVGGGLWYLWALFFGAYAKRFIDGKGSFFAGWALILCLGMAAYWFFIANRHRKATAPLAQTATAPQADPGD